MASYIPLHVHSQYSVLNATASISSLVQRAKALQMPALALTDFCNMHGAVEFIKACVASDIKPILGIEIMLAPQTRFDKKKIHGAPTGYPLILLAKDREGYQNLCKLSSLAYLEGFYYNPRIDKELLEKYSKGLICLSGPLEGKSSQLILSESEKEFSEEIDFFLGLFGKDFYLELQNHEMSKEQIFEDGMADESWLMRSYEEYIAAQKKVNARYTLLSQEKGIPCLATGDVYYIEREDWKAHEILLNVQSGEPCEIWEKDALGRPKSRVLNPKRRVMPSHAYHFKSSEEMSELFQFCPQSLAQTFEIEKKCNISLDFNKRYYPVFIPPYLEGKDFTDEERSHQAENYLKQLCEEGISKRYLPERLAKVKEKYPKDDPLDVVKKRLAYELEIITSKGMCDYLLIVHDFISWAKQNRIPVGPGRGSGAGSIVLFLIGVTDIEPLRFNLFFERFINPECLSYPDIDVDICMERRGEVIDYTIKKYGKEKIAQIITFGTMKAKMAIKDVGRVLSVPLSKVNVIAKLVPEDPNMTLEKALELDPELKEMYESDEEAKRTINLAKKVEGSIRNTGIHAAGVIISAEALTQLIPVCISKDSDMVVTQYSMKPVEAVGMLKMDFLGLKTLTSIQKTIEAIKDAKGIDLDWVNLPLDDANTFALLNQGKTLGVFQLESSGMQELSRHLHIDRFEEIIAVGALYRPGPMEMIPSFIQRKHGKEAIEFDHPLMKDILSETYGIMVYQEQVMQIASLLAGYSLGEGDLLRKAIGKKDKEEMQRQRKKFISGAKEKGVKEETAVAIFDKIEKFASYGFNKSHAAAYGYLSYVTAYLKANYPKEWLAALMTCDMDDISKIAKHIRECHAMHIALLPPDINESDVAFASKEKGIRFALAAIKSVGKGVVEAVIEERKKNGHFESLYQFIKRVDIKRVGKKTIETLIDAGCFDFTQWTRKALKENLDSLFDGATREQKEKDRGFLDFFSELDQSEEQIVKNLILTKEEVPKSILLSREKELLGFYLSGHPMDAHRAILQKLSCVSMDQFNKLDMPAIVRSAFILEDVTLRFSKTGRKFAIAKISDGLDFFEIPIWADLYEKKSELLEEGQLIYAVLHLEKNDSEIKLSCKWLEDLTLIDDAQIKACDTAYDKAKEFLKKGAKMDRFPKKKKSPVPEVKKEKGLHVAFNIEMLRLSHVIKLKQLFKEHTGSQKVMLHFYYQENKKSSLLIDEPWGVNAIEELEIQLKKMPGYLHHSYETVE